MNLIQWFNRIISGVPSMLVWLWRCSFAENCNRIRFRERSQTTVQTVAWNHQHLPVAYSATAWLELVTGRAVSRSVSTPVGSLRRGQVRYHCPDDFYRHIILKWNAGFKWRYMSVISKQSGELLGNYRFRYWTLRQSPKSGWRSAKRTFEAFVLSI